MSELSGRALTNQLHHVGGEGVTGICSYCGSTDIGMWQGGISVCRSERCHQLHDNATYEPCFGLPVNITPTQQLGGWLVYQIMRPLCACIPIGWLIWDEYKGWRKNLAIRVHGSHYFWYERAEGRI